MDDVLRYLAWVGPLAIVLVVLFLRPLRLFILGSRAIQPPEPVQAAVAQSQGPSQAISEAAETPQDPPSTSPKFQEGRLALQKVIQSITDLADRGLGGAAEITLMSDGTTSVKQLDGTAGAADVVIIDNRVAPPAYEYYLDRQYGAAPAGCANGMHGCVAHPLPAHVRDALIATSKELATSPEEPGADALR